MSIIGTILAVVGFLGLAMLGIQFIWPGAIQELFRGDSLVKWSTFVIALANIVLLVFNSYSLRLTREANERAENLFMAEDRPLIDVTPIGIIEQSSNNQALTVFSIVNYSGFEAYNIGMDLKYGTNSWILEWRKAHEESISKGDTKGIEPDKLYPSRPLVKIKRLPPGKTTEKDEKGIRYGIVGSLNLETEVCAKGIEGMPVYVRVSWENSSGHVFDTVHEYRLIGTKDTSVDDPAGGRSLTFVPQGILSQKDGK